MSEQDPSADEPSELEKLEMENDELRRQVFIAKSMIEELRQALSSAQVVQAQLNGQLKYANQATL